MMVKRRELEKLARQQPHQHEYDSDEETDVDTGTWEHRLRAAEMDITREWAVKLTDMAHGKHHIGDFIPAHELEKFMKTYSVSRSTMVHRSITSILPGLERRTNAGRVGLSRF